MSELPPGIEPAEPPTPRDSSSGIVLRGVEHGREVLLGVRSRKSRFMPGHLAFPGGTVDPADGSGDAAYRRCLVREGLEVHARGDRLFVTDHKQHLARLP